MKMNQLSQEKQSQEKQQQTLPAIVSAATLPAELESELSYFQKAAAAGSKVSLLGTLVLFKKGVWIRNESKEEIEPGTRAVALMTEARHGFDRWSGKKV